MAAAVAEKADGQAGVGAGIRRGGTGDAVSGVGGIRDIAGERQDAAATIVAVSGVGGIRDIGAIELPLVSIDVAIGDVEAEGEGLAGGDGLGGEGGHLGWSAGQRERMASTAADCQRRRHEVARHAHRQAAVVVIAVAQLAIIVVTHGPQRAVALHKERMVTSRRDGDDVAGDADGPVGVGRVAVAQLAVEIIAHGPQRAIVRDK